jgi:hypothetical protein
MAAYSIMCRLVLLRGQGRSLIQLAQGNLRVSNDQRASSTCVTNLFRTVGKEDFRHFKLSIKYYLSNRTSCKT